MRSWWWTVPALVAAGCLVVAGPAVAAGDTDATRPSKAVCSFDGNIRLDPGLPSSEPVKYTSVDALPDDPGHIPLVCTGWVRGAQVLPVDDPVVPGQVGSYMEWGSTLGDCEAGDGDGWYAAWIRTTAGVQYVTGDYRLHYDGKKAEGTEAGKSVIATFTFIPVVGRCAPDDPLLEFVLHQDEVLMT